VEILYCRAGQGTWGKNIMGMLIMCLPQELPRIKDMVMLLLIEVDSTPIDLVEKISQIN